MQFSILLPKTVFLSLHFFESSIFSEHLSKFQTLVWPFYNKMSRTKHYISPPTRWREGEAEGASCPYGAVPLCSTAQQCFDIFLLLFCVTNFYLTCYFPSTPDTAVCCLSLCTEFLWFELFFSGMLFCIFPRWIHSCWYLPLPPVLLQW